MNYSEIPQSFGDDALRRRLAQAFRMDASAAAIVWKERDLETRTSRTRRLIADAQAELASDERALAALRSQFPALAQAGIDVEATRRFVLEGVGAEESLRAELPVQQTERKLRTDRREFAIDLQDLVAAGLIERDQELIAVYKGRRYTGRLQPDFSINVAGKGSAPTLSWAGRMITPNNINGWRFWQVERNGRLVDLARLRAELARGSDDEPAAA